MLKVLKEGSNSAIKNGGKPEGIFEAECQWYGEVIRFDSDEIRHDPYNKLWYTKCPHCTDEKGGYVEIREHRWKRVD